MADGVNIMSPVHIRRGNFSFIIKQVIFPFRGPGSSVGIANAYRLDGPGIESGKMR